MATIVQGLQIVSCLLGVRMYQPFTCVVLPHVGKISNVLTLGLCLAGDIHFEINTDNIMVSLYCHDKYDCPSLDTACKQYLSYQVDHLEGSTAVPILNSIARFGTDAMRSKCIEWTAKHMNEVMQCVLALSTTMEHCVTSVACSTCLVRILHCGISF